MCKKVLNHPYIVGELTKEKLCSINGPCDFCKAENWRVEQTHDTNLKTNGA